MLFLILFFHFSAFEVFLQFFNEAENCKNHSIAIITKKINYLIQLFILNYYTYLQILR